jgi:hypothetical protein
MQAKSLPQEYVPELRAAAQRAGLDWGKFKLTDNSCPPHPETPLEARPCLHCAQKLFECSVE